VLPPGSVFGGIWPTPSSRQIAASSSKRMTAVRPSARSRDSSEREPDGVQLHRPRLGKRQGFWPAPPRGAAVTSRRAA
jgi:hypothetical protein